MNAYRYRVAALIGVVCAIALLMTSQALAAHTKITGPPPPNDDRDNAQPLTLGTAVTGTTVGSTVQATEPDSDCATGLAGTVWYSITFGSVVPSGVGVALKAGGNLDGAVDVFQKVRSQNERVNCQATDKNGVSNQSFTPTAHTTYLIRVDQDYNSDPGPFSLKVFALAPAPVPPGPPLTHGHVNGVVDASFVTTAAYSMQLTAATTYKLDLVNRNQGGGCFRVQIFAPGSTDFSGTPLLDRCAGYTLYTPTQSGKYSFLVTAADGVEGNQHFGLAVAPATSADMAPGIPLANLSTYHGLLRGNVDTDLRLFSFNVTSRSQLTLSLSEPSSAQFTIQLLSDHGRQIDCSCDGDSGPAKLVDITRAGHYYVAVQADDFSYGTFSLTRQSQTITATHTLVNHVGALQATPGQSVDVGAVVNGADGGSVQFELQYFDPLFGWQFRGYRVVSVVNQHADFRFDPPVPGHWRFMSTYSGTRSAATSVSRYAELDVTTPG